MKHTQKLLLLILLAFCGCDMIRSGFNRNIDITEVDTPTTPDESTPDESTPDEPTTPDIPTHSSVVSAYIQSFGATTFYLRNINDSSDIKEGIYS